MLTIKTHRTQREKLLRFFSQRSATNRSGKKLSVAQSRSSRQRENERTELENLIAKQEVEQQLRDQEIQIENEREAMKPQEQELRLRQRGRELDNEGNKAEPKEQQRHLQIELTKGSSGASGSAVDDTECVRSRTKTRITPIWLKTVTEHSGPSRPLSPDCVVDPPKSGTQNTGNKRFSAYPKTTPLFQPGAGLFSAPLTEPSILKKPEIRKSIRVTDPQTQLTKTTFQQQGTSVSQNRFRSQSPINNSRNRSTESRNRSTVNQTTPKLYTNRYRAVVPVACPN